MLEKKVTTLKKYENYLEKVAKVNTNNSDQFDKIYYKIQTFL